jgi:hypothetical protein
MIIVQQHHIIIATNHYRMKHIMKKKPQHHYRMNHFMSLRQPQSY